MVYFLLKNPETLRKLRAQIDEVLGEREVQYEDFAKLPYLIGALFLLRFPYLLPFLPFLYFSPVISFKPSILTLTQLPTQP